MGVSRGPGCARFEGPLATRPDLEYEGGLRRSSTGTIIRITAGFQGKRMLTGFFQCPSLRKVKSPLLSIAHL